MKSNVIFSGLIVIITIVCFPAKPVHAQKETDTTIEQMKAKFLGKLRHFTFGVYIDTYYNGTLGARQDTSNVVPYSANCPIRDQIRMNVAAVDFYYNSDKVRGKLSLQYGDAPNLLASPNMQFIKTLNQANFGFKFGKRLWTDFGYIFNPIGYESSWAANNQISFVTIGGYFEPGSILGAKVTYEFNPKFSGGFMVGNPFSLAYAENTHFAGIIFLNYKPLSNVRISYSNFFGNQALVSNNIKNNILYNNLIITYNPHTAVELAGQFDFASQTNSKMPPDTTKVASMYSGFVQGRYIFAHNFSITGRFEFLNDPHGFLTGVNANTNRGLRTYGMGISMEYRPVPFGYLRAAYRLIAGYPGSRNFVSNTEDNLNAIIFSAGVRF